MNAIICKHCGDILVSRHVHDFKMCKCDKVGVDGGNQYLRRLGGFGDWIEMDDVMDMLEALKIGKWATTYGVTGPLEYIKNTLETICNKEDDNDTTSMEDSKRKRN